MRRKVCEKSFPCLIKACPRGYKAIVVFNRPVLLRNCQSRRGHVHFRAEVEGDGGLVRIDAVCNGEKPQFLLARDIPQLPVYAVVHGKDFLVEVYDVYVLSKSTQSRDLGR